MGTVADDLSSSEEPGGKAYGPRVGALDWDTGFHPSACPISANVVQLPGA